MADAARTTDSPGHPGEPRRFGYWAGHFVVVGSMIGAGILATSGRILRDTANPAALLGLWALGGFLALCGAVTIAELSTRLPRSGGDYVFVREGFGRAAGFVSGWATFTLGFAAPTAVIAVLAAKYLTAPYSDRLAELVSPWVAHRVVPISASMLIIALGLVHTRGHRHSSWLQIMATSVTAAVLLLIALGGLAFGTGDWNHLSAGAWPTGPQWRVLGIGLVFVGYAYAGWNGAAYLAGEIRDPVRNLPRCLIGGAATVMILYLLVNLAYIYALDPVALTGKSDDEVDQIAALAVRALFGETTGRAVAAALGLCLVAAVSAYLLTGSRVAYAMACDKAFPGYAARRDPVRGTPTAAILTLTTLAATLVWAGSFEELLGYASVGLAALTGLTVSSVFALRRRTDLPHPYRLPFYPFPPLAFLALTIVTIGYALADEKNRVPGALSLITLFVGVPLSRLLSNRSPGEPLTRHIDGPNSP